MPLRLHGDFPKAGETDRRYYMIDVQVEGRRVRISSGTRDKRAAEQKEQAVVDAVRRDPEVTRGELLVMLRGQKRGHALAGTRRTGGWTFKDACDACLRNGDKWLGRTGWARLSSQETLKANTNSLQRYIDPARPVVKITQEVYDDAVRAMLLGGPKRRKLKESTVNRLMECLRSVMLFAKFKGELEGDLPHFEKFEEDYAREFVFQPHQEAELFAIIPTWNDVPDGNGRPRVRDALDYLDLFVFLADVGCRLRRGLAVRWEHIVPLPGRPGKYGVRFYGKAGDKKSRDRTTPLSERAVRLLQERHKARPKSVGPFIGMTARRSTVIFQWAKERSSFAHVPDAVVHSFRHTCATRLLELTGDIKLVQEWLGHSCLKTTSDTYAKVMTRGKMRGLDALDAFNAEARQVTDSSPFQDWKGSETGTVFRQVIEKAA